MALTLRIGRLAHSASHILNEPASRLPTWGESSPFWPADSCLGVRP